MAEPLARTRTWPLRPSQRFVERVRTAATGSRTAAAVRLSLWFGLLAGLGETMLRFGRILIDPNAAVALQINRHAVWMITVSNMIVFAVAAIPLVWFASRRRGPATLRRATGGLAALAALALLENMAGLLLPAQLMLASGIGAWSARRIEGREAVFEWFVKRTLPVLGLGAAVLLVTPPLRERWSERRTLAAMPKAPAGAANVIWIVLDTVRADATGLLDSAPGKTPKLVALARRGFVFEEARSPAGWTLPSHTSMFTGRWPRELYSEANRSRGYPPRRLEERFTTVAEYLRDHGYTTAGFVANTYFCNAWYGLGQGFLRYEDAPADPRTILRSGGIGRRLAHAVGNPPIERDDATFSRRDAATIHRETLAWLDERPAPDRPFFLFLNFFDAHDPYLSDCRPLPDEDRRSLQLWHSADKATLPPERARFARQRYDACVSQLDSEIGRLLAELEQRGLLDETLLIVTSDHGELFGERGRYLHGPDLHREATHVPLLIVPPGGRRPGEPARVAAPVSLRDLPATIVHLAGLNQPTQAFPGRSLARFWQAAGDTTPDPVYCDTGGRADPRGARQVPCALVAEGFSYIRNGDGREELYNRAADPAETEDLAGAGEAGPRLERMREIVAGIEGH